jgi:uncharacterized protein (DUF3084 family)
MLVTLADQCEHKLMEYRQQEKDEIKKLKHEKKQLESMMHVLDNDKHELQSQVDKVRAPLSCIL